MRRRREVPYLLLGVALVVVGVLGAVLLTSRAGQRVDALVLTARGTVAELTHLACAPPELAGAARASMTGVVLTHGCRYRTREVEEALGVPLLAVLPQDAATATMLAGAPAASGWRGWRRTGALLTALADLASHLVQTPRPDSSRLNEPRSLVQRQGRRSRVHRTGGSY